MVRLPDKLMSSPDHLPRSQSSPPDFNCKEIPPTAAPKVTPSTRSPTDGHPRRLYRDEAESDGSPASMHNLKSQRRYKGHGYGPHVSNNPSSGAGTSSACGVSHIKPQPYYERKRKARRDKAFNDRGEPFDTRATNASVRQHLLLNLGGNRLENQSRTSKYPPQRSAKTFGRPLATRMKPLPPAAHPPQNRRRKERARGEETLDESSVRPVHARPSLLHVSITRIPTGTHTCLSLTLSHTPVTGLLSENLTAL
ncbi:hypothetical protein BU17DRAFT_103148 [Hysterangium stoloniferum]|nr:hypothetical protein BU17DRAFT_103148 [Hysterangium stoloniferum]